MIYVIDWVSSLCDEEIAEKRGDIVSREKKVKGDMCEYG